MSLIIAGTGHRPDKLGGYGQDVQDRLRALAVEALKARDVASVISGMALGWDTALALAALELNLPLFAYVPFKGQESRWPSSSQTLYRHILSRAEETIICSPGGYSAWAMQRRNERMVDDCDLLLALWNGDPTGGTANCMRYAEGKCTIINLWSTYHASSHR